jgi:hypothetical protein
MADLDDAIADETSASLEAMGIDIIYIPLKGQGDAIATRCFLSKPQVEQSSAPGYFGHIEVDPLVIVNPQVKDEVVWADDTRYWVGPGIVNGPRGMVKLALHRKFDL